MAKYDIVGATGCATGVAHTFMAAEALEKAAQKLGYAIKIETHGQTGVENRLTSKEIQEAQAVVVASDIDVGMERFAGKKLVVVPVARGLKEPEELIHKALDAPIYQQSKAAQVTTENNENNQSIGTKLYTSLMNGVSHMLPFVVAGGVLTAIFFSGALIRQIQRAVNLTNLQRC